MAHLVKNLPAMQATAVQFLEKGMTTHSSILAWRIPWTEEPSGLQSMGCKEWDKTVQPTFTFFSGKVKISLTNINNLRYADDTTLMVESKEELEKLLIVVQEESEKAGLKLNIQKN